MNYASLKWNELKNKDLHLKYDLETIKDQGMSFYKVSHDSDTQEIVIIVEISDKPKFLSFVAENDLFFKTLEQDAKELGDNGFLDVQEALVKLNME
jgi:hypothetical protein